MKYRDPLTGQISEVSAPWLNPELIKGKTLVPEGTPLSTNPQGNLVLTSDLLNPTAPVNVPPTPTESTPSTTTDQATIDNINKLLTPSTTTETTGGDLLQQYLKTLSAPPSLETAYGKAYEATGISGLNKTTLEKEQELQTAQNELATLNAELSGLTAEQTAIPIRLQQEATGRGITAGGLAPIQTSQLRDLALRALPLQARVYASQAKVAAAQGNAALAQRASELAQKRLDTVFNLKSKDAENTYNYWKDARDKIFTYATEAEKTKLATQQKADDRAFTQWQNVVNDAQTKASALMSAQPDLAAKITARIGQSSGLKDTTLSTDLAALMAQAKPAVTETEKSKDLKQSAFKKALPALEATKGKDGFVDPKKYMQLRVDYGALIGDVKDFDNMFSSYLSPQQRVNLGIEKITGFMPEETPLLATEQVIEPPRKKFLGIF